jgi:hypothetical protein
MCAAINQGSTCLYGVAGSVSNLYVQSYSVSATFNAEGTVVDEDGLTVTWRGDDRKTEITVEGICRTSAIPVLGASFTFTAQADSAYPSGTPTAAFSGWVTKVDEKGSNKGFTAVTVTAMAYEAV